MDPGAKVNSQYYRDVLLSQQMLPAIKSVVSDMFIFLQDSAPAHRARETNSAIQVRYRKSPRDTCRTVKLKLTLTLS